MKRRKFVQNISAFRFTPLPYPTFRIFTIAIAKTFDGTISRVFLNSFSSVAASEKRARVGRRGEFIAAVCRRLGAYLEVASYRLRSMSPRRLISMEPLAGRPTPMSRGGGGGGGGSGGGFSALQIRLRPVSPSSGLPIMRNLPPPRTPLPTPPPPVLRTTHLERPPVDKFATR